MNSYIHTFESHTSISMACPYFCAGSEELFLVVDESGIFRDDNFQKAVAVVHDVGPDTSKGKGKESKGSRAVGEGTGEESDIYKLVKMIMERNYDPVSRAFATLDGCCLETTYCINQKSLQVIVFSFSKKECDGLAKQMSTLDLCDGTEKMLIKKIFTNALACLSEVRILLIL
jgi:ATP-dependent RNA helicase DOB1